MSMGERIIEIKLVQKQETIRAKKGTAIERNRMMRSKTLVLVDRSDL
jgi:hypothetical protein